MLKKFHVLFALALAFPAVSHAINGGPFDNGDFSATLDSAGIYQVAMRFHNGSGFAQWGPNVQLAPNVNQGAGNAQTTALALGTPLNRSVIYYKGVTYVGNAMGMVDQERSQISGFTNSYTNLAATSSANSGAAGAQTVTASSIVVSNSGIDATANSQFEGHIYTNEPILKFNGSGELTIINPTLSDSIFAALQNLIGAIPTAATQGSGSGAAINAIIDGIDLLVNNNFGPNGEQVPPVSTAEATFAGSDHTPMKVFGSRIFFAGPFR